MSVTKGLGILLVRLTHFLQFYCTQYVQSMMSTAECKILDRIRKTVSSHMRANDIDIGT